MNNQKFPSDLFLASPWLVIGGSLILLVIVVIFSVDSAYREKNHMISALAEKGESLITAFEAGARTGMMRMRWGGGHLQRLIEETGKGPDIKHIIIADSTGRIISHSNPGLTGEKFDSELLDNILKSDRRPLYRIGNGKENGRIFELFDIFRPTQPAGSGRRNGRTGKHSRDTANPVDWSCNENMCVWDQDEQHIQYSPPLIISVGLDMTHFESVRSAGIRNAFIMSGVILALGMSGFVSLFWLQNYRLTRQRLEDTSAFADKVISSLPLGIIATDSDGRIVVFNETIAKISGISIQYAVNKLPGEIIGSLWDEIFSAPDESGISEKETRLSFNNGLSFYAGITTAIIGSENGTRKSGVIVIIRDLTEIKELENSLVRHEKLAAIGSLSAGVAHEIRNPLSSIKGLATYFRDLFPDGSDSRDTANVMIREVDRINRVIKDLLEFARPSEISRSETDFVVILNHVLRLTSMDAKSQNIEIRSDIPETLKVFIDVDRFSQVLINLFRNSMEAMEQGGVLAIKVIHDIRNLVIEVSDTGEGIDENYSAMIFNPYFTTKNDGTGLGLAVAQKIVESHGGSIRIRSKKGSGTSVIIEIPRAVL